MMVMMTPHVADCIFFLYNGCAHQPRRRTGCARDAPRTSRGPGPPFRIRRYTGQYNKEHARPVPVLEKRTSELSGHAKENQGFV